jgi:hypothetical protein
MSAQRFRPIRFGEHGRFLIELASGSYRVRDAEAVTDAEVRLGIGSPVVFHSQELDKAIAYCQRKERP